MRKVGQTVKRKRKKIYAKIINHRESKSRFNRFICKHRVVQTVKRKRKKFTQKL